MSALMTTPDTLPEAQAYCETLKLEVARLSAWVNDLQSGMFVNCVYCGHRYGPAPGTPVAMADVLKAHIEVCPQHPMSKIRAEVTRLAALWSWVQRVTPATALAAEDYLALASARPTGEASS